MPTTLPPSHRSSRPASASAAPPPTSRAEDSSQGENQLRRRSWSLALALLLVTGLFGLAAQWIPTADAAAVAVGTGGGHPVGPFTATGAGPVKFTARLDREAVMDRGDGTVLVELTLHADELAGGAAVRTPTDLVVVLDRSGSMEGQAMQHALAATRALVERLGTGDRFALVSYSDGAQIEIPLALAVSDAASAWSRRIDRISAGGGTHMASGLDLGHRLLAEARAPGRTARLILISDGHANQGDATPAGLSHRAGRAVSSEYVLSALGVGDGFDEQLMTRLANAGTGNFYYVSDVSKLSLIFNDELLAARETVAQSLTIELIPGAGVRVIEAAGYPMEHADGRVVVRPGALFAGQERRIWLTLAIDEQQRQQVDEQIDLGAFALAFRTPEGVGHRVQIDGTPAVRVVHDDVEFTAARNAAAYIGQLRSEGLGQLSGRVAQAIADGDAEQADRYIDEFHAKNVVELRSMGVAEPEEDAALAAALEMKDEVAAALAPEAPAAASVQLRKRLAEKAVDDRRQGAKR